MNYSDEEIVKKVLAGEKQLFGVLVDRYQQPVYNLMLRYAQNIDEAADLSQDAFVRIYERLWLFRSYKVFFPWMYSLAVNLARDWNEEKPGITLSCTCFGMRPLQDKMMRVRMVA